MKFYAHVDADCFYVSCERLRDACLEGRPVAVLGNQGACVIARSYEMKAAGVAVAMPVWRAKRMCPEAIFVKRDFRWYGVLSRAMQEVLREFTDEIEYYSVDESFLYLGQVARPLELAQEMQDRMRLRTGLPVSVGLGPTRKLAKVAAKKGKPLGVTVIDDLNREELLADVPIFDVPGIGRRLKYRCYKHGIKTALDFARRERKWIKREFHKPGEQLWYELNGRSVLGIQTERASRKIVSRGGSVWGHVKDRDYLWGFLVRNLERFCTELWGEDIEILKLTVILRRSDGRNHSASVPLPDYTSDQAVLLAAMEKGFEKAFKYGPTYCRVHLVGLPLRHACSKQLNLFSQDSQKAASLKKLKAELNQRFGLFTLRNASSQMAGEVFKDKVSDFEITDIPGKHLF